MDHLHVLLHAYPTISFDHVRREANKTVDQLANAGVEGGLGFRCDKLEAFEEEEWVEQCHHMATRDVNKEVQMVDQEVGRTSGDGRREHTYTRLD